MQAGDVEDLRDVLDAMSRLADEVRFGALQRELGCGDDLRPELVLQSVDEDIVRC